MFGVSWCVKSKPPPPWNFDGVVKLLPDKPFHTPQVTCSASRSESHGLWWRHSSGLPYPRVKSTVSWQSKFSFPCRFASDLHRQSMNTGGWTATSPACDSIICNLYPVPEIWTIWGHHCRGRVVCCSREASVRLLEIKKWRLVHFYIGARALAELRLLLASHIQKWPCRRPSRPTTLLTLFIKGGLINSIFKRLSLFLDAGLFRVI